MNEGAAEWPPSPWRLLRAIVATWKRKLADDPCCEAKQVEELLCALLPCPSFALPAATTGHIRHYMPLGKKGPRSRPSVDKTTLIFDAFVALERQSEVFVVWSDAVLSPEQRETLGRLLGALGFLGRAESWCIARLVEPDEEAAVQKRINSRPADERGVGPGQEALRVLCPDPETALDNEHTPKHTCKQGKGKTKQTIITPLLDPDWHLAQETLDLHAAGWSGVPGARWVAYLRPTACFAPAARHRNVEAGESRPLTACRFLLDSAVLPPVQETLPLAELARRLLMGIYKRQQIDRIYGGRLPEGEPLPRSPTLSGKSPDGSPLQGHGHAYYLPTDEDGDGRLDHLTVFARSGFGPTEQRALDALLRLPRKEGAAPLRVVLSALGQAEELGSPPLARSREWVSATPFLVTRHAKRRGRKRDAPELLASPFLFVQQVLREELARWIERQGLRFAADQVRIEPLCTEHGAFLLDPKARSSWATGPALRPIQFKRYRSKRSDDGGRRPAGAFRVVFPEPVRGPLCLGHSGHFGLGLFLPATTSPEGHHP